MSAIDLQQPYPAQYQPDTLQVMWSISVEIKGATTVRVMRTISVSQSWIQIHSEPYATGQSQYLDKGLGPDSYFRYRIEALNTTGKVLATSTEEVGTTESQPDTHPTTQDKPTVVGTYRSEQPHVLLDWGYSPRTPTLVEYQIFRGVDGSALTFLRAARANAAGSQPNTAKDHDIKPGHVYVYEVRGVDAKGTVLFASVNDFRQVT